MFAICFRLDFLAISLSLSLFFRLMLCWFCRFIFFDSFLFCHYWKSSPQTEAMCVEPNAFCTGLFKYTFAFTCVRWNFWLHLYFFLFFFWFCTKISRFQKGPTRLIKYFKYSRSSEDDSNTFFCFLYTMRNICATFSYWPFLLWETNKNIETFPFGWYSKQRLSTDTMNSWNFIALQKK